MITKYRLNYLIEQNGEISRKIYEFNARVLIEAQVIGMGFVNDFNKDSGNKKASRTACYVGVQEIERFERLEQSEFDVF